MKKLMLSMALAMPATVAFAQTPAAPATAPAMTPDTVVLEAGSIKMTAADFDQLVESLPPQIQQAYKQDPERARRMIGPQLADVLLLEQEARKQGLEKDPKVRQQLKFHEQQALVQALVEKTAKSGSDEATLKQKYEKNKANYDQVIARHILIRAKGAPAPLAPGKQELTDEQAKAKAADLRDRIVNKKEDFAALAKTESDDLMSGMQGGDLGAVRKGQTVPEFEKTAFSLKPGEVSEPVKTQFGYHLIQVQEHKTPSFEEVKPELAAEEGPQNVKNLVERLQKENPVKLNESFFGKSATRPNGMPAPAEPAHPEPGHDAPAPGGQMPQ